MYTKFYGFSEKPFELTPDPKFLYLTAGHREALSSMISGIKEQRGLICITGEVGTGKTTLIHLLLSNLGEKVKTVFIFHPTGSFKDLLENICLDLAVKVRGKSADSHLYQLIEYSDECITREKILAIIIDEAQNLPEEVIERLGVLCNPEIQTRKRFQIVLVGQPELEDKLSSEKLREAQAGNRDQTSNQCLKRDGVESIH